jgi:hypothetical protein
MLSWFHLPRPKQCSLKGVIQTKTLQHTRSGLDFELGGRSKGWLLVMGCRFSGQCYSRIKRVKGEVAGGEGVLVPAEAAREGILSRRERVIRRLSRHCIYCEVTRAPESNSKHWYKTCYRSQGLGRRSKVFGVSRLAN